MASDFAQRLIHWQKLHGRHDLPWQGEDAYRVWLSEIMLQQTQVATVIPYYQRFTALFQSVTALADATEEQVLAQWSGLGYYARARNLHRAARIMVERHHGEFPRDYDAICALPGIGRSTAAAICALAYGERRAILDGNVKRVLTRYCGIAGHTTDKAVEARLWQQAEALLPEYAVGEYIQAQMDLGATLCTRSKPRCMHCPVQNGCVAFQGGRVNDLPTPRKRNAVPERRAIFLLLVNGHDVLLEKRPATGIWGGLWSLPQFDDEAAAKAWYLHNNLIAGNGERLESFIHVFTHFRLHITPLRIRLRHKPKIRQPGYAWLDRDDALNAAIPAPVRLLLDKT